MTERAKRKLRGESVEEENATPPPDQVRLGRDGKPWRPRKRRDSEAIKRDEMVEQFLHENRCTCPILFALSVSNLALQWTSTRCQPSRALLLVRTRMTAQRTTELLKSSAVNSWMPCLNGEGGQPPSRASTARRRMRRCLRGPS